VTAATELLRFCLVGALGFAVDSGLTLAISQAGFVGPLPARIVAFVCAATVTFWFHGKFTFRHRAAGARLSQYLFVTAAGALINVGVYALWIRFAGQSVTQIFLGIALGSAIALGFNFLVTRHVVFRHR
jgi:putative flippase GtrA